MVRKSMPYVAAGTVLLNLISLIAIQDLGNPGWNWQELLSAMKKESYPYSLGIHSV